LIFVHYYCIIKIKSYKNIKLLLVLIFTTLIYSSCKKAETIKQPNSNVITKNITQHNPKSVEGNLETKTPKTNNTSSKIDLSNPYIDRVMHFEKLDYDKRVIIANSLMFRSDMLIGVDGNLDIFKSMEKDVLLEFYETLFNSDNIGVYNLDGSVIVESKTKLIGTNDRAINGSQTEFNACRCWTSIWDATNDNPCRSSPNNQCMVYNSTCCG